MLMVGKLGPWEVQGQKDKINEAIRLSVTDAKEAEMCWEGINKDQFAVWGVGREDGIIGYIVTTIIEQGPVRSFLIFAMASWGNLTDDEWREGFGKMVATAKVLGCKEMRAFTENPEIVRVLKTVLGWTVKQQCWFQIDKSGAVTAPTTAAIEAPKGPEVNVPT